MYFLISFLLVLNSTCYALGEPRYFDRVEKLFTTAFALRSEMRAEQITILTVTNDIEGIPQLQIKDYFEGLGFKVTKNWVLLPIYNSDEKIMIAGSDSFVEDLILESSVRILAHDPNSESAIFRQMPIKFIGEQRKFNVMVLDYPMSKEELELFINKVLKQDGLAFIRFRGSVRADSTEALFHLKACNVFYEKVTLGNDTYVILKRTIWKDAKKMAGITRDIFNDLISMKVISNQA